MKEKKHLALAQETLRKLNYDESRMNLDVVTTLPYCPTGVPPSAARN